MNKDLKLADDLRNSIERKMDEISSLDNQLKDLQQEKNKAEKNKTEPCWHGNRVQVIAEANVFIRKAEQKEKAINEAKAIVIEQREKMEEQLAGIDEDELIRQEKEAKKVFDRAANEYAESLMNQHTLREKIVELGKKHGLYLPNSIKCKKLARLQESLKGDEYHRLRDFINQSLRSLKSASRYSSYSITK